MNERPILMSAQMVRAILDGRKTQTRRIVKPQPDHGHDYNDGAGYRPQIGDTEITCPYGQPGDRLWQTGEIPSGGFYYIQGFLHESEGGDSRPIYVNKQHMTWGYDKSDDPESLSSDGFDVARMKWKRAGARLWVKETWKPHCEGPISDEFPLGTCVKYRADGKCLKPTTWTNEQGAWCEANEESTRWRPSIFMPRWASRITLKLTSVRVERLQDISDEDAVAEGVEGRFHPDQSDLWTWRDYNTPGRYAYGSMFGPIESYRTLWKSINGKGSWDKNPWVWILEFKRL